MKQDVLVQVFKKDAVDSHKGTKRSKPSKHQHQQQQQQQQQQQPTTISDSDDKLVQGMTLDFVCMTTWKAGLRGGLHEYRVQDLAVSVQTPLV